MRATFIALVAIGWMALLACLSGGAVIAAARGPDVALALIGSTLPAAEVTQVAGPVLLCAFAVGLGTASMLFAWAASAALFQPREAGGLLRTALGAAIGTAALALLACAAFPMTWIVPAAGLLVGLLAATSLAASVLAQPDEPEFSPGRRLALEAVQAHRRPRPDLRIVARNEPRS